MVNLFNNFAYEMIIPFSIIFWLSNLGLAHFYGYLQYKKHMVTINNRIVAFVLFLSLKRYRFSVWAVIQQSFLLVYLAILLLSWAIGCILPLWLCRICTLFVWPALTLANCVDIILFDHSDEWVSR